MNINGRFMSEPETQAYINSLLTRIAELEACVAELEGLNDRLVKENEKLEKQIEIVQTDKEVDDIQIAHYDDDLKRKTGLRAVAEIERLRAENKKAKELLKEALIIAKNCHFCDERYCDICKNFGCEWGGDYFEWEHADEALALIGEDINVPGKEDGDTNG